MVFSGLQGLLSDQTPAERRAKALRPPASATSAWRRARTPMTDAGRASATRSAPATRRCCSPTKLEVEQALAQRRHLHQPASASCSRKYKVAGAEAALRRDGHSSCTTTPTWARATRAAARRAPTRGCRRSCTPPAQAVRHRHRSAAADRSARRWSSWKPARRCSSWRRWWRRRRASKSPTDYVGVIRALKKRHDSATTSSSRTTATVIDAIDPIIREREHRRRAEAPDA